jgi:hypothetical protein
MPIDFPTGITVGYVYTYGSRSWQWNGTAWDLYGTGGATGATGATGPQGPAGQSSNYYNYKVHTSTQTPPTGNGEIRYNNASQTGATLLYVDHLDDTGNDIDVFLSLLKQNDNLIIQDATDSNNYQTWRITSAPTVILNDYTTIPVTGVTSAGAGTTNFSNNLGVLFIVFSSPIATEYVQSIRGLTGTVGITNGSGIGLSVSGQTMTFSNTGVLSIDGGTGAVTNVARTNTTNTFTAQQTILIGGGIPLVLEDSSVSNQIYFTPSSKTITVYEDISGNQQALAFDATSNSTVTLPSITTTLAGLANTQTFTSTNTFNVLTNFVSGICAAGGTFGSLVRFNSGISSAGATLSNITTIPSGATLSILGNAIGNVVTSFNGLTGTVTGVTTGTANTFGPLQSFTNGISAAGATLSANTIIPSGSTLSILGTVTGNIISSIDGATGAITNVARTNVNNTFTASQLISGSGVTFTINDTAVAPCEIIPATRTIRMGGATRNLSLVFTQPGAASTPIVSLPVSSTTLAGLSLAQTFTNTNTFNALTDFAGGISGAGGTFSSQARFLSGITVAGGATFATDISVNSMRVGKGGGSQLYNVALGANTLTANTTGNFNLAIGTDSLSSNLDGTDNVGIGYATLNLNTTGLYNIALGSSALIYNSSGTDNVAIGTASITSTGSGNVGIGSFSLGSLNGARNQFTAIGYNAGRYRSSTNQTLLGGTGGIFIGYEARASANAQTNEIVIGTQAVGLGSNTAVIGATAQTAATIYGLLNATSGISAPGGTFSGLARFNAGISAAGGTFSGTQTFVNGATFSAGINITGNVTSSGALIGYQQINAQTGITYTAVLTDVSKLITLNNASGITMTIPLNSSVAFPTGTVLYFAQLGAGQVGFTGSSGVTLNSTPGRFMRTQYSTASAIQLSTNVWLLSGDLTA